MPPTVEMLRQFRREASVVKDWSWETHNAAQEDPSGRLLVYTLQERGDGVATVVRDLITGQDS